MDIANDDDYDGGTTYSVWLEMHPYRYNNLGEPLWEINDHPSPWAVFITVEIDAVNFARITKKDGLFWKHPSRHIIAADLNVSNPDVSNDRVVGGRNFNVEELRGSPKDTYFKWDPKLIRSWRIREFPEKPATQSRWSGRILLCVRNRGELVKFPGLGELSQDLLVRWFVCNCYGITVMCSAPSKLNYPDSEEFNFNNMDERSPGDTLLWVWPGKEGIETSVVTSQGNGPTGEGGRSSLNEGLPGGGIGAGSEGTRSNGGGRQQGGLVHCRDCHKPPLPSVCKEIAKVIATSQDFQDALSMGLRMIFSATAGAIVLLGIAAILAISPPPLPR